MDSYAQLEGYKELYKNIDTDKEIEKYLEIASIKINDSTLTKIEKIGFENLTSNQQENIKKATIEQCNYIYENGLLGDDSISNYSIGGDLSITKKETNTIVERMDLSKMAYFYLKSTGLMVRII